MDIFQCGVCKAILGNNNEEGWENFKKHELICPEIVNNKRLNNLEKAKEKERLAARELINFREKEMQSWIDSGVNLTDIMGNESRLETSYEEAQQKVDELEKK